jgi:hypothetical protein
VRALLKELVHSEGRKHISSSLEDAFLTRQRETDEDGCDPALLSIDEYEETDQKIATAGQELRLRKDMRWSLCMCLRGTMKSTFAIRATRE